MSVQKNLVSIITPTYNHEKYISECIESAINQTYDYWEMIIIDDGSTDSTPDIISNFHDDRIKYIRQENIGPYKLGITYNKALNESKGEFIAILEGDDFWPSKKLEYQLKTFKDKNVVMSHGRAKFVYGNKGKRKISSVHIREINSIINNEPRGMALYGLFGIIGSTPVAVTVMFRKSFLEEIGGFQQPSCIPLVDGPTVTELSLKGKFKFMKKNLGYFRRHKNSITHKINKNEIQTCLKEYRMDFLARNRDEINSLDISLMQIQEDFKTKKDDFGVSIIHGKELYNIGLNKESKDLFKAVMNNRDNYLSLRLLSLVGLISIYSGLDLIDLVIKLMAKFEEIYWNFKFEFQQE